MRTLVIRLEGNPIWLMSRVAKRDLETSTQDQGVVLLFRSLL